MHLAIVGSRTFTDYDLIYSFLVEAKRLYGDELVVVSGGAAGADSHGAAAARALGVRTIIHPAPTAGRR